MGDSDHRGRGRMGGGRGRVKVRPPGQVGRATCGAFKVVQGWTRHTLEWAPEKEEGGGGCERSYLMPAEVRVEVHHQGRPAVYDHLERLAHPLLERLQLEALARQADAGPTGRLAPGTVQGICGGAGGRRPLASSPPLGRLAHGGKVLLVLLVAPRGPGSGTLGPRGRLTWRRAVLGVARAGPRLWQHRHLARGDPAAGLRRSSRLNRRYVHNRERPGAHRLHILLFGCGVPFEVLLDGVGAEAIGTGGSGGDVEGLA